MAQTNRRRTWILAGLLLVFGAVFVQRGPIRAIDNSNDLAHLYVAAALWLEGGNPYDGNQCVERLREAGDHRPEKVAYGSYYPPPSIATLAPIGLMSWDLARLVWLLINLVCCFAMVWAAATWLDIGPSHVRWMLSTLLVLAWGPVATTLSLGQLSLVSGACAMAGVICLQRGITWLAGLLIGLSCLIKPQLGAGFLVLVALRRDWGALAFGSGLVALMTLVGIGRMMLIVPNWFEAMSMNYASGTASGEAIDASIDAPMRFHMIDLRPVLHLVLPDHWVTFAALSFVAVLALFAIWRLQRIGLRQHVLLSIAGVGLLMLMPVYHRYYDAVLLMPLLVLVTNSLLKNPRDRLMCVIALVLLPLIAPLPSFFAVLESKGVVPESIVQLWPWKHIVVIHQPWCLLIAAIALICWTWRRSLTRVEDDGKAV
jgi:hypothetical protein